MGVYDESGVYYRYEPGCPCDRCTELSTALYEDDPSEQPNTGDQPPAKAVRRLVQDLGLVPEDAVHVAYTCGLTE